eukprot:6349134-Heterocapsa_arctica.AAC.1
MDEQMRQDQTVPLRSSTAQSSALAVAFPTKVSPCRKASKARSGQPAPRHAECREGPQAGDSL